MADRGIEIDELLTLANLALKLGEVERVTLHPDGRRRESDTTHSVMLALVAAVVADRVGMDPGRAALFAVIHDLPEAYAGDTDTSWGLSEAERRAKTLREETALGHILRETGSMPFLRSLLLRYELGNSPEAQLVRLLDKLMPKAVRLLQLRSSTSPPLHIKQQTAAIEQLRRLRRELDLDALDGVHDTLDAVMALLLDWS